MPTMIFPDALARGGRRALATLVALFALALIPAADAQAGTHCRTIRTGTVATKYSVAGEFDAARSRITVNWCYDGRRITYTRAWAETFRYNMFNAPVFAFYNRTIRVLRYSNGHYDFASNPHLHACAWKFGFSVCKDLAHMSHFAWISQTGAYGGASYISWRSNKLFPGWERNYTYRVG